MNSIAGDIGNDGNDFWFAMLLNLTVLSSSVATCQSWLVDCMV